MHFWAICVESKVSSRLLREVGVEGRDAAGEAGLYLPAEAVSDDLVFVNTAPHVLSPPAP